jgi:DNA-binding response OmpR family regulator
MTFVRYVLVPASDLLGGRKVRDYMSPVNSDFFSSSNADAIREVSSSVTSKRIAMIDDSELELKWTQRALEPHGFELLMFNRSIGIQAFVLSNSPSLILLDVNMPALNGEMACRFLKSNPDTRSIPILFYSSLPAAKLKELVTSCGADGYIVKDHDVHSLVSQLNKVVPCRSL